MFKRRRKRSDKSIFKTDHEYYAYLVETTKRYSDVAKGFVHLATAALVLPIAFARQLLGVSETQSIGQYLNGYMYAAWIAFGISIVTGITYQHSSVSLADDFGEGVEDGFWARQAPVFFWIMATMFVFGVIMFCAGAAAAAPVMIPRKP